MKLDGKLDEILDMFRDGHTFRYVCSAFEVSSRTMSKFLSLPENKDHYRSVLQESADAYVDKAEEALINAPADKNELYRARELAQHYRWLASKRNPNRFGDKLEHDHRSSDGSMSPQPTSIVFTKPDAENQ